MFDNVQVRAIVGLPLHRLIHDPLEREPLA